MTPTTSALVQRLHEGGSAARAALITHTCGRLRILAHQMLRGFPDVRRWVETDDVLQNALVRLWRALEDTPPESALHFHNLAALQIRRELLDLADRYLGPHGIGANHHTDPTGKAVSRESDPADGPQSVAEGAEFHRRVEALPEEEREVVGLLWYEGLTQEEAAKLLGVCRKTVGRRWQSARLALERAAAGHSARNRGAMTPTAFREAAVRREALALLPVRVQVLLAAEWAGSVLGVITDALPDEREPGLAVEAVLGWAEQPTEGAAGRLAEFLARGMRNWFVVGTAEAEAVYAVQNVVLAAHRAATTGDCAATVAECAAIAARACPSPTPPRLDARWRWLFRTYQQALGPAVPFDPQWRTWTAVVLARGIVWDRALDRMPILADALRDAGCVEEALDHLQGESTLADWTLWNLLGLHDQPQGCSRKRV